MKFATVALALTFAAQSAAFAPSIPSVRSSNSNNAASSPMIVGAPSTVSRNTELNLFGFGKAAKFNKPAKVAASGSIEEKEVRALFELWNDALATGDSKIVASRYTKVRTM